MAIEEEAIAVDDDRIASQRTIQRWILQSYRHSSEDPVKTIVKEDDETKLFPNRCIYPSCGSSLLLLLFDFRPFDWVPVPPTFLCVSC
jgi:hypothetical protein